ncbi:MAG: DUF262 domain-containing protein [Candidatus Ornithospirochaeta sp.]|nr:DUF262 domain-containing protein [Candidatus Ornithospirochaeta sp.]
MGRIGISRVTAESLLSSLEGIPVPSFKRSYSWDEEKTEAFVRKIADSGRDGAFLGVAVFTGSSIVDGLSRIVTLALLCKALGLGYPSLERVWTPEELRRIKANYKTVRRCVSISGRDLLIDKLRSSAYLLRLDAESVADSFCFFDPGSERGVSLDPADILKAYHLCSMRGESESVKKRYVSRWESIGKKELLEGLSIWLMVRLWSRGEQCPILSFSSISEFEGIDELADYPFVKRLSPNGSVHDPVVNGRPFFDACFRFLSLLSDANRIIDRVYPCLRRNSESEKPSYMLALRMLEALSIAVLDRFGEEELAKSVPMLFRYSYALLFKDEALQWKDANEHMLSPSSILRVINTSFDPYRIRSYDIEGNMKGLRNVSFRVKGPAELVDFDKDFGRFIGE